MDSGPLTTVTSWRAVTGSINEGLRASIEQAGLMASCYYVIACWIPEKTRRLQSNVMIYRFFEGVWAATSKQEYSIGDITQTIVPDNTEGGGITAPNFGRACRIGKFVEADVFDDKHLAGTGGSVAQIRVKLNLESYHFAPEVIGYLGDDGFGYCFAANNAILLRKPVRGEETNDFLGAPIVMPSRRLKLLVCIDKKGFVGSPKVLSYSNRFLLAKLMKLDVTPREQIDSLLWPFGKAYDDNPGPNTPLQYRGPLGARNFISNLPKLLKDKLEEPLELSGAEIGSTAEVLGSDKSQCFLFELSDPHPSLTYTIVWRLAP
jgi:hypothetical protein